jgi:WW domain-containing oxidoreductase
MMTLKKLFKKRHGATGFGFSSTAEDVLQSIDLRNKVIVITGTNSGLGAESARVLAARGACIIGLSREPMDNVDVHICCNLSVPQDIQMAATKISQLGRKIDAILCNAGVMAIPVLQEVHGYEKQFFVNHIAHFILVTELLPILSEEARVVVVTSEAYRLALKQGIEFDNLSGAYGYSAWRAYGHSKLANLLFSQSLAQRFTGTKRVAIAVHPGAVDTRLSRYMPIWQQRLISALKFIGIKNVSEGAATQVFATAHPAASVMNGTYLADCNIKLLSEKISMIMPMAEQLWQISMEIKERMGFTVT